MLTCLDLHFLLAISANKVIEFVLRAPNKSMTTMMQVHNLSLRKSTILDFALVRYCGSKQQQWQRYGTIEITMAEALVNHGGKGTRPLQNVQQPNICYQSSMFLGLIWSGLTDMDIRAIKFGEFLYSKSHAILFFFTKVLYKLKNGLLSGI